MWQPEYTSRTIKKVSTPPGVHIAVTEFTGSDGYLTSAIVIWRDPDPDCPRCFNELGLRPDPNTPPTIGKPRQSNERTMQCGYCGQVIRWDWEALDNPPDSYTLRTAIQRMADKK